MSKCLNCKKPLKQSEGKRKKEYCNSTCRSNLWQKKDRKKKAGQKSTAGEVTDKNVSKKPRKKAFDGKKTKLLIIDEPGQIKSSNGNANPKTLKELKELCPPQLKGFDRSQWIASKRIVYGI